MAKSKFLECVEDIKRVAGIDGEAQQKILIPGSSSLYIPGTVVDNQKFMVDIGTGYYVEKGTDDAIAFYQKKIDKLNSESVQIQNIIKDKSQTSLLLENQIRQAAIRQHEEMSKANAAKV
ncbi:Prefoldin subunit 5 [Nakaseomyces bracarensis]|uniref:Prefoldin subunit 5 n=1 Tax=Nakaseomyces bracarensis TaxID=273131 RepID=A0ABR4NPE6_9SACH